MRLRPNLPQTPYKVPRGYGPASIPFTGGNPDDPLFSKPSSACFWTKEQVFDAAGLDHAPGKIFLGRVDQKMIGLADNRHVVTIAGSRGGKSACLLIPNLFLYPGSALVLDPKGELARETARRRSGVMGQRVHVLDPWSVSGDETRPFRASFDPLAELEALDPDDLIDDADMIADALIIQNERDPHWTESARALVRGLILWLVVREQETDRARLDRLSDLERTPCALSALPSLLSTVAEAASDGDKEAGLFETMAEYENGDFPAAVSVIRNQGAMMLGTAPRERASILSTARTQLAFLESPQLAAALSSSAFALADLKRQPSTVYLCLPASRMGTHARWMRLIVNLAVAALEREATPDGPPVLFILEEFAALGHMRALEQAAAYIAGFGVKLWTVLQDLTQLKRHYKDGWETFLGNAGVLQAFSVADMTTCEYLSKRLGETTLQITNKQDVSADQSMKGDTGLRREFRTQRLLTPDEVAVTLRRLGDGQGGSAGGLTLVLVAGRAPFLVDRVYHGELVE